MALLCASVTRLKLQTDSTVTQREREKEGGREREREGGRERERKGLRERW